jgi:hypothetical protein
VKKANWTWQLTQIINKRNVILKFFSNMLVDQLKIEEKFIILTKGSNQNRHDLIEDYSLAI